MAPESPARGMTSRWSADYFKNHPADYAKLELALWLAGISAFLFVLGEFLFFPARTFSHDHIFWGYPAYQYFAEHLLHGDCPFWNPYSHGGEPFYPVIVHSRFLDPTVLLPLYAGSLFTKDLMLLYNWTHVFQLLVMALGVYLALRPLARHPVVRLSLVPILLFSSLTLVTFRQPGFLHQFAWVPYVTLFAVRILYKKDVRWINWLALAGFTGLTFQSYFFTGLLTAGLFFLLTLLFTRRDLLSALFLTRANLPKLAVSGALCVLFLAPNLVLMRERQELIFPARISPGDWEPNMRMALSQRQTDAEIEMSYDQLIKSGARSTAADFLYVVCPSQNRLYLMEKDRRYSNTSEAIVYFGIIGWSLALLGMTCGRHPLRKPALAAVAGTAVVMMGSSSAGLHEVLFNLYPPLWYVRNTHSMVLVLMFPLLYFYVLGFEHLQRRLRFGKPLSDARRTVGRRKWLLMGTFTAILIESLWFLCKEDSHWVTRPYRLYGLRLLAISAPIAIGFILRKRLSKVDFFLSILFAQVASVILAHPEFPKSALLLLVFGAAPLFAVWRCGEGRLVPRSALAKVLVGILVVDLAVWFHLNCAPYRIQPHLELAYGSDTRVRNVAPPSDRHVRGQTMRFLSEMDGYRQAIRYPELISRTPTVFSPKAFCLTPEQNDRSDLFEDSWFGVRYSSFLMRKTYCQLLYSDFPIANMKSIFALDAPAFQVKSAALSIREEDLKTALASWGKKELEHLTSNALIVDLADAPDPSAGAFPILGFEAAKAGGLPTEPPAARVQVLADCYSPDRVEVEVETAGAGLLYWSNGFDPRWRAFVNGESTRIYRANVNFMAVGLTPGRSRVRWEYCPNAFRLGLAAFYLGVFITLGGAGFLACRARYRRAKLPANG